MNNPDLSKTIRIVAAVVDVHNLTLYKEDGSTIVIPQGDPNLRRIVEEATPQLLTNNYADVVIFKPVGEDNSYADFEKKQTSGIVKLFRIAKEKLTKLFAPTEPVEPTVLGDVPSKTPPVPSVQLSTLEPQEKLANEFMNDFIPAEPPAPVTQPEATKMMSTIDEIMAHAVSVSDPEFHDSNVSKQGNVVEKDGSTSNQKDQVDTGTDTIIAVVDGQIIPGMEKIKTQFDRAAKLGSTGGVEKFLQRIAPVMSKRSHSVEDLLKFLERADLPIADDGTILIYKILQKTQTGQYVDCHTSKVTQWVGAYVCMDESLVDHNRNNECSNGLHVARRGYIQNFSGNVCVLAKLAPEDVIAVPEYDANKMRVCGYHIIAELPQELYNLLNRNRPITDTEEGKKLLYKAMTGDHIGRTDEVRIGGEKGSNVTTKKLSYMAPVLAQPAVITPLSPVVESPSAEYLDDEEEDEFDEKDTIEAVRLPEQSRVEKAIALGNPDEAIADAHTNPLDVVKVVEKVKTQLSRKEQAQVLYDALATGGQQALDEIHAFKKACKCSWEKLGLPDINGAVISVRPAKPAVKAKPKAKAKVTSSYDKKSKKVAKSKAMIEKQITALKKAEVKSSSPKQKESEVITPPKEFKAPPVPRVHVTLPPASEGSPRDRIAKLLSIGLDATIAQKVYDIKKASKKSWDALYVQPSVQAKINDLLGK